MEILNLFYQRRSIRRYKDTSVEVEKIQQLISAGLLAPSARNLHSPQFIIVTDKEILKELAKAREQMSSFIEGAAVAVVVLGDSNIIDIWIEDSTIAASFILIAAQALGLGACWIQVRNRTHNNDQTAEDYVRKLLNIPAGIQVGSIIAAGYPDETKRSRTQQELKFDKVFENHYGNHIGWYEPVSR